MTRTNEQLKAAVDAGMAYIESKLGSDWVNEIDFDTLAIASPTRCILGQLGDGSMDNGMRRVMKSNSVQLTVGDSIKYGILANINDDAPFAYTTESDALTKLWVEAIQMKIEQETAEPTRELVAV